MHIRKLIERLDRELAAIMEQISPTVPVSAIEKYSKTFALLSAVLKQASDVVGLDGDGQIMVDILFDVKKNFQADCSSYAAPAVSEEILKKICALDPEDHVYPYAVTMIEILTGKYGELSDADFSVETLKNLKSWFWFRGLEMPEDGADLRYGWAKRVAQELVVANTPAERQKNKGKAEQFHAWAMANMGLPDRGLFDLCSVLDGKAR